LKSLLNSKEETKDLKVAESNKYVVLDLSKNVLLDCACNLESNSDDEGVDNDIEGEF
ncbi:hypothetical protein HK100_005300, partial [Physocladia obscura]